MVIKNKILITTIMLCILLLSWYSCKERYYETQYKKPRPIKENVFNYEKKNFFLRDTILIDTMSIYMLTDTACTYCEKQNTSFIRFFANGKCIEIYGKIADIEENVNILEKGIIGYYYISKKNVLKMQYFSSVNGGQVELKFGLFDNGDLLIYDAVPMWGSLKLLQLFDSDTKKLWKKIKIDGLKPVVPDW
jgi:hypothetical protein